MTTSNGAAEMVLSTALFCLDCILGGYTTLLKQGNQTAVHLHHTVTQGLSDVTNWLHGNACKLISARSYGHGFF